MDYLAYTASLPKKRLSAGVLLLNNQDELLIVKPVYRSGWLIPGGVVEVDESPYAACTREVQEELHLQLHIGHLLTLDYQRARPDRTECIHFIF